MSVHYKFKSNLDHDTVTFDGLNISVADLKKSIMHQKKIGKSSDFDLQITNAQTKEVYDNDEMLVPKNTSVIVARVPVQGGSKKNWNEKPDLPLPIGDDDLGRIRYDRIAKSADLVNANTSEEDKVKAMITQSSPEFDPSKYVKSRSMTGPLPPTYTCFRCGKQGHWIKNCPTNNPDIKRSTGIPRSFMVPVDGPEHKGALLTSSGDYAVPLIDHQAYKEVKKEKPPFVPQDEPVMEPEAEIPEELLCMVCKDLLQDAVLIPCCGNSFCDECVRSVLLDSENHECPVCHEIDVSPNTLIPNRFLRTAVLNYKNETGYTRVKRSVFIKPSPSPERVSSPQPSPDSTFESQGHQDNAGQSESSSKDKEDKVSVQDVPAATDVDIKTEVHQSASGIHTPENVSSKVNAEEELEDIQPGTPLADEPIDQHLPIQTIGQEHYNTDRYQSGPKYSRHHREEYHRRYSDESRDPQPISTIGTITNTRQKFFAQRSAPLHQPFSNQRIDNRSGNYSQERDDYRGRYDRRHGDRGPRRNIDYDRPRDSRYHQSNTQEYPIPEHDLDYDIPSHHNGEDSSRRHQERYRSPPHPILIPPPVPAAIYPPSVVPAIPPPHPHMLPVPQVFPPQPPPPGASPVNTAQPPPPGVGPLLPVSTDAGPVFKRPPYESEDPLKEATKLKERSIDDRMEEFQRKLDKRDRKYPRDRGSRSRSRSVERHRSRSISRSRSYSSSKSWTRSGSRSSTRTSRSRSRTPFSSRSRSRSYSHSRSRSWSKKRSYTRSRSRTRTGSRSRSRSRIDSKIRRGRASSRERVRSPRHRTRSRSFSPKHYRGHSHRSGSYPSKHNYNPPQYGTSYQSQFGPPQAILPIPVMRAPAFPPHHLPPIHHAIQPIHSRPIEPYSSDRSSKYPPYGDQYPVYDSYPPKYETQRCDREQRIGDHKSARYDKRPDYQRHQEEVGHRIPGWVGDRSREYKPRYRNTREQRKEIRELPQIPESEMRAIQTNEPIETEPVKRKEDKSTSKHKKHHHHHKSKDGKRQDTKIVGVSSGEKHPESSKNLIKVEVISEKEKSLSVEEESKSVKSTEKGKDKKHKHKKHKVGDHLVKKKRSKKEKVESVAATDSDIPTKVKIKKKKIKQKSLDVDKPEEIPVTEEKTEAVVPLVESQPKLKDEVDETLPETEVKEKPTEEQDVLDIFADEPDNELVDSKLDVSIENSFTDVEVTAPENSNVVEENVESDSSEKDESAEEENVLRVDVPGISKWEREESEDEYSTSIPQRKNSAVAPKVEKDSISSDIISRAENALIANQFKPRIENKGVSDSKDSSEESSPERSPAKHKEVPELKSVVNTEKLKPDTLKVTISNNKEKRAVYSRKEDGRRLPQSESIPAKRSEGDRSGRYRDEPIIQRSVAVYPVREDDRVRSHRDRGSDARERKYSPPKVNIKSTSREVRDYSRRMGREIENREKERIRRDERKDRSDEYRNISNNPHVKSDRRKVIESVSSSRSRRQQELFRSSNKRSRSRSSGSVASYNSNKRRNDRKIPTSSEDRHRPSSDKARIEQQESVRRKHSPIKPPGTTSVFTKPVKRDYHDELKFEPDYDEFSDEEEKGRSKEWAKRKASSPDGNKKSAKMVKTSKDEAVVKRSDKTRISFSSSEPSDSESSDSDEAKESKGRSSESDHKQKHKKSKHKKHKKHKHKHKKKKSHKSKKD